MFLNKVIIVGNLTRDPELKVLPSGNKVANFSVATNRVWKSQEGQKMEAVEFHNIVVFGRQAETSAEFLKKGQSCLIEGRLQTQSWEDKDTGKKMYRTEIVAERVQFGYSPNKNSATQSTQEVKMPTATIQHPPTDVVEYPEEDINPDDIPF